MKYFAILLMAFLFVACGEKKGSDEPAGDMETSGKITLGTFELDQPASWISEQPANAMRVAQYAIKGNEDVKILVFNFGEQAGSHEANMERWKGQFEELKESSEDTYVDGKIKFLEAKGSYKVQPRPMSQEFEVTEGYMMLASIIPDGETAYYFKVTGPEDILSKEKGNFINCMKSYKKK